MPAFFPVLRFAVRAGPPFSAIRRIRAGLKREEPPESGAGTVASVLGAAAPAAERVGSYAAGAAGALGTFAFEPRRRAHLPTGFIDLRG